MDHYAMKLFVHLSESLHFGKTGRACNISPSALSRQIQRIENEVGRRLFERDNRSVQLTPAGLVFKAYAREALGRWQELLDELSTDQRTLKGEITIYCSVTASLSILPEILAEFKASYPQVHIRLQTGDAGVSLRKVIDGEADLAVAALPDQLPPVLEFKKLSQVSLAFIAPKASWEFSEAVRQEIAWQQIPMILSAHGTARRRVDAWFRQQKIKPNIYAQVFGNEAILSMVTLGCGIGVVPRLVIENSPLQNKIVCLDVNPPLLPYDVGICVQKRKMKSRLVQAFWETGQVGRS